MFYKTVHRLTGVDVTGLRDVSGTGADTGVLTRCTGLTPAAVNTLSAADITLSAVSENPLMMLAVSRSAVVPQELAKLQLRAKS